MLYIYIKQKICEDYEETEKMDLVNEVIKDGRNKGNKKQEEMSKTTQKKENILSSFRSTRIRKMLKKYLD
jgi:hypothetical protein